MTNEIQYTIEWAIKPGGEAKFNELAKTAISNVKNNEPGMKGYQWYYNKDKTKCYTSEWHTDEASMVAHFANVEDVLPQLLECSDITRFEVFGTPGKEATEKLEDMGAQIFAYHDGFTR